MIDTILKRMGYREISPNVWVKPVAFTLFVIKIKSDGIDVAMWIVGRHGELLLWNSKQYPIAEINSVSSLQYVESDVYDVLYRFSAPESHKLVPELPISNFIIQ